MLVDLLYPQGLGTSLPAIFSPWVSSEHIAEEAVIGQLEKLLGEYVDMGKVSESHRNMLEQKSPVQSPGQGKQRTVEIPEETAVLRKAQLVGRVAASETISGA